MEAVKEKDRFKDLLDALENGWKIDEPVLGGEMWRANSNKERGVYHFIIRNKTQGKTILLSLPSSPALEIYLLENNLQVNSLS